MSSRRPSGLASGDYLRRGNSVDDQTREMRVVLIDAILREAPDFFESLRRDIFPRFARYARVAERTRRGPGYWELGWRFETWDAHASVSRSRTNRFKPYLLEWASAFHADGESWVLEGALETLAAWYEHPHWREGLDVTLFCPPVATEILVDYERFTFEDSGWSPQWERWPDFRARVVARFETQLAAYETTTRGMIEALGAERSQNSFSRVNFDWFVMYQMLGMSSTKILNRVAASGHRRANGRPVRGDESTVRKGVNAVAKLVAWKSLRGRSVPRATGKQIFSPLS
jgi:hypothetical protein